MGSRGEGWVIGQFMIGAAILAATFFVHVELPLFVSWIGIVMLILGAASITLGILHLGENLTPFPKPKENNHALVTRGIYGIVRHPIYFGFAFAALGWSVYWGSLIGIALALFLFVWFDLKARREENWLAAKYSEYAAYQARVKKLIPFIY